MVSGHLQNHFQTAALTRVTWRDGMAAKKSRYAERRVAYQFLEKWESIRRVAGTMGLGK